jgi:uncharacterized DUF497 family protein
MRFEWDENNNLSNQEKHGLNFELAQEVFDDPLHLSKPDRIIDYGNRANADCSLSPFFTGRGPG